MKLLFKILFFVVAIFQTNICEAKVFVFGEVVTQIRFIENAIENKNEVKINLENDIAITCKSQSDLLDYRSWTVSVGAIVAKTGENLAFGLKGNLSEFSEATGFKNYRQFTSGGFQQSEIQAAIENPGNNLHFNLQDFTRWKYLKYINNPVAPSPALKNISNWELYTIYNTPGALPRTTFYNFTNGSYQTVPKPF